jgi:hypothetical protein
MAGQLLLGNVRPKRPSALRSGTSALYTEAVQ